MPAYEIDPGAAGLAFLAFGFNLVDCGALLGHRLGSNAVIHKSARSKAGVSQHARPQASLPSSAQRTFTL